MRKLIVLWLVLLSLSLFKFDMCHNPVPLLLSISPEAKVAHLPAFTLTANGSSFVNGSKIVFNGVEKPTHFIGPTRLRCQLDPGDIGSSGTVPVLVRNPAPGGGESGSLDFTILENFTFTSPRNISDTRGYSGNPAAVIDHVGEICVAWKDGNPENGDIYFSRSTDQGASWSYPLNISDTPDDSDQPALAVSGGRIYVVWEEAAAGNRDIYFSRSSDSGASWSSALNVSHDSGSSTYPALAVDSGGAIQAAWQTHSPGNDEIYFCRSTDWGATWSAAVNVSHNPGLSWRPVLAVDGGGRIYGVWQDSTPGNWEIYFSRSGDHGATWSTALNISGTADYSWAPAATVDHLGRLHLAWREGTVNSGRLFFRRSSDHGSSWSPAAAISDAPAGSEEPVIGVNSSGHICVVWRQGSPISSEIYFSRSTNLGVSWSSAQNISHTPGGSVSPAVALNSLGHIQVVWQDFTPGNYEIYFCRSINHGSSWSSAQNISNASGSSTSPAITVNGPGHLQAAWRESIPGNPDIYFKSSEDGGGNWARAVNVSKSPADSSRTVMAKDGAGNLYAAWLDDIDYRYEVCFSRSSDLGKNWTAPVIIDTIEDISPWKGEFGRIIMAADHTGHIYVLWEYNQAYTTDMNMIYFSRSSDFGSTWSPASIRWTYAHDPAIALDRHGNIDLVFALMTIVPSQQMWIQFVRSTDQGLTWSTPTDVSTPVVISLYPDIAVDGSDYSYAVWLENVAGQCRLKFSRATDPTGTGWTPALTIYGFPGTVCTASPVIALDRAKNINVVWLDLSVGDGDLFFSRSIDLGANWSVPLNISNTSGISRSPDMAVDRFGHLDIVFSDNTYYSNTEIYHTASTR